MNTMDLWYRDKVIGQGRCSPGHPGIQIAVHCPTRLDDLYRAYLFLPSGEEILLGVMEPVGESMSCQKRILGLSQWDERWILRLRGARDSQKEAAPSPQAAKTESSETAQLCPAHPEAPPIDQQPVTPSSEYADTSTDTKDAPSSAAADWASEIQDPLLAAAARLPDVTLDGPFLQCSFSHTHPVPLLFAAAWAIMPKRGEQTTPVIRIALTGPVEKDSLLA